MSLMMIAGYVLGVGLLFAGLSTRNKLGSSTRQLSAVVGAFVLIVMIALTLDHYLGWWNKLPKEILGILGIFIVLERTVRIVRGRRMGGAILIDLGRIPLQDIIINLFAGAGLVWIAVADIVVLVGLPHWTFRDISLQLLGLSVSYAVAIQALAKRSLMEGGVFFGTGLSAWNKIESFSWEKETGTSSTLILHKRTAMPLLHFTALSVRAELMGAVEEVFAQRAIPRRTEETKPGQ